MNTLLTTVLNDKFGMTSFREGQVEAMEALFEKNRLLCIQPTGYGKSLLYQVPSCILGGITLVISPLLALIRDQVEQLQSRFNIAATSINSDQTDEENIQARNLIKAGKIQILFISPEQLDHVDRFNFLLELPVKLFVIDEAHCISTWGHDFRPSYRMILKFCQALKSVNPSLKILGLTATADERVEKDIAYQLSSPLEPVHVWRDKMDRANLHLSIVPLKGIAEKLVCCEKLLSTLSGNGLIYCSTRENTELVTEYLSKQGLSIVAYHAGLESEEKRRLQIGFAKSDYSLMAATTALGMGIDKKDIRYIIHFDFPGSITAYYQEIGRAGRDGKKSQGILLYDAADRKVQDYFINAALPSLKEFQKVIEVIKTSEEPLNLMTIKRLTGYSPTLVTIILAELIEQEQIKKISLNGKQIYQLDKEDKKIDLIRYETQKQVKTAELNKIIHYAEQTKGCRMALLRDALGDPAAQNCRRCDCCEESNFKHIHEPIRIDEAMSWLSKRPVIISAMQIPKFSQGLSLYDGKLRTPPFLRFMKQRQISEELDPEIFEQLVTQAKAIALSVGALAFIPSKTWKAQTLYAQALSNALNIPLLPDLLYWDTLPEKRQGEWFNNDQRRHNVQDKLRCKLNAIPSSGLLLLDDYIGSAATLKEAARAIRKTTSAPIIPITIATIKWHLGKPGFV